MHTFLIFYLLLLHNLMIFWFYGMYYNFISASVIGVLFKYGLGDTNLQ